MVTWLGFRLKSASGSKSLLTLKVVTSDNEIIYSSNVVSKRKIRLLALIPPDHFSPVTIESKTILHLELRILGPCRPYTHFN